MNSHVHIEFEGSMTGSQHSFCALTKGKVCHNGICTSYTQLHDNLWMIYDSLKNRILNGNGSRSFLIPCKAAELADSLIISNLAGMLLSGAGEK